MILQDTSTTTSALAIYGVLPMNKHGFGQIAHHHIIISSVDGWVYTPMIHVWRHKPRALAS